MKMEWFEIITLLFSGGILTELGVLIWSASKRDAKLTETAATLNKHLESCASKYEKLFAAVERNYGAIQRLEGRLDSQDAKR